MQAFAYVLRREMKAEGHSQADTARLANLSQPAISAYLKSNRTPDLTAFARLLSIYPRLLTWLVEFSKTL